MYHAEDKTGNLTEKNHRLKEGSVSEPLWGAGFARASSRWWFFCGPILFMLSLLKDIFKRCFLWHGRTFSQHPSYISSRSLLLPDCFKEARNIELSRQREPLWALSMEGRVGMTGKDAVKHACTEHAQAIKQERRLQHRSRASSPHVISNYQYAFYMENYTNPNTLFSALKMLTFHFTAFQGWSKATMSSNPV